MNQICRYYCKIKKKIILFMVFSTIIPLTIPYIVIRNSSNFWFILFFLRTVRPKPKQVYSCMLFKVRHFQIKITMYLFIVVSYFFVQFVQFDFLFISFLYRQMTLCFSRFSYGNIHCCVSLHVVNTSNQKFLKKQV